MAARTAPQSPEPLALQGISRRFRGVHALRGVDTAVAAGSIHAWIGENGAGKSTLGRIAAGALAPNAGRILVDGRAVRFASPRDALTAGIAAVQQEISLVPHLSVAENVFLGLEDPLWSPRSGRRLRRRSADLTRGYAFGPRADARVGRLAIAEQQQVEILRALAREARVIVFDEPTSSLTVDQAEHLHDVLRRLAADGTAVVYISHFLKHICAVTDTVTILRDGQVVRRGPTSDETEASLIEAMIGRPASAVFPAKCRPTPSASPILEARGLSNPPRLADASFALYPAEILGLGGLVGSGRSEIARALFGADGRRGGTVLVDGRPVRIARPTDAIALGIAMVPESRKEQGLHLGDSVADNLTLAALARFTRGGWVRRRDERHAVGPLLARVGVPATRARSRVRDLSGGNQQKVLFGKWLATRPRVLICDEPTRGVDVGAKQGIYELLGTLAATGMGVLLISSELEELLGLSHRVLVLRGGRIVEELDGDRLTETEVMGAAFGSAPDEEAP
jgi:simple sugar transport system ATP-binding protein/ribose transport system ATP-binding protein